MKQRITYLVEYEDSDLVPDIYALMNIAGGKLVGVQFGDALQEIEELTEALNSTEES